MRLILFHFVGKMKYSKKQRVGTTPCMHEDTRCKDGRVFSLSFCVGKAFTGKGPGP
jgi:hypothetical protein